jgi:hypothetical protein
MLPDRAASLAAAAATAASPGCPDFSLLIGPSRGLRTDSSACCRSLLPLPLPLDPLSGGCFAENDPARLPAMLLPATTAPRSAELLLLCNELCPAPGAGLAPRLTLPNCCCCWAGLPPPASGGFKLDDAGLKLDWLKLLLLLLLRPGMPLALPPIVPAGELYGAALPAPPKDPVYIPQAPPAEAEAELQPLEGADGSLLP